MTTNSLLGTVPLIPGWESHEFSDFIWAHPRTDALRYAVRDWGLAYAYALAPLMGDRAKSLTDELGTCGKAGRDSGWHEAAERGKSLKPYFVADGGASLLDGYWPCHIAMQLDRSTVDAALEIAWAMRRGRGYTSAQLLADLKGHIKGGAA